MRALLSRRPTRRPLAPGLYAVVVAATVALAACGDEPPPVLGTAESPLTYGAVRVGSSKLLTQTVTTGLNTTRQVTAVSVCAEFTRRYDFETCDESGCFLDENVSLPQTVYSRRIFDPDFQQFTVESGRLKINYTYRPQNRGADSCVSTVTNSGAALTVPLDGSGIAPELTLTASPGVFAARRINTTSAVMGFTIKNDGDAGENLTVTSVVPTANAADWVVTFNAATALAPGEARSGTVQFSPKAPGARDAQVRVLTNDPVDSDEVFDIKGTGLFASATAPATATFAATVVGQTSTTMVTVTNAGTVSSKFYSALLSGAQAADFNVTAPSFPVELEANGGTVVLTVQCRPSASGARTASLTMDTDSDVVPQDPVVALTCPGVKPDITVAPNPPGPVAFGNVAPGTPAQQIVTVTNSSTAGAGSTLNVAAPTLGGAHATDFSIMPAGAFTLAPGASRQLTVTFTPGAFGNRAATLTLISDDQESPTLALNLTGAGFGPEITLTTASTLDFGDVRVSATSPPQTATIRNDGNANLTVASATLVGGQAGAFAIASGPTNGGAVVPGASLSWGVTCRPTAVGSISTTLRIASNDASEGNTDVTLRCVGTQGSLEVTSPALPVTFPNTDVGATANPIIVRVRNAGTANVAVAAQPVVTGAGFALDTGFALPLNLAPGATAQFTVKFTPTVDGQVNGNAAITYDGTSTLNVALTGTGLAAVFLSEPAMHAFGNVLVGSQQTRVVDIANKGSGTLNVLSANLTGDNAFTRSGTYPLVLAGGANTTITVTCRPLTTGAKAATMAIDTDADNNPADVDIGLTCTGVKPDIMVSAASLAWGDVAPGTSVQRTLTIMNMAGATVSNLSVQAPALSGAQASDFTVSPPGAFSLTPGAQRVLTVTFTPGTFGARAASLRIASDDQETPTVDVPLTGTGRDRELTIVAPGGPLTFGSVKLGTTATPAAITLRNDGNADLAVSGVTSAGADAAQFVVAGPGTPATIAPGTTMMWTVTCAPSTTGNKVATLELRTDDADEGLRTFAMTCTGTQASLVMASPATMPVAFASTRVGEDSPLLTIVVQNTGTAPLAVSGPPVVTPAVFTVVDTFTRGDAGFTLQPGQNDRVTLRFRPTADGLVPGMLTVNWDASSLTVPLDGPGTVAIAGVTPSAPGGAVTELGAVCVGQPRTQHFTVDSTGTGGFKILGLDLTGAGFSLVQDIPLPTLVGPGVSFGFDVVAAPPGVSAITGTLTVTTDVPGAAPMVVPLRAMGIATGLGVAPAAGVDFGTVEPDTLSTETAVTITNCNAGPLAITQAILQGEDRGDFVITGGTLPTAGNPIRLAPSDSTQWLLAFQPDEAGASTARFHLTHDGMGGGTDVPLSGRGAGGPDIDAGIDAGADAGIDAPGNPLDDDGKSSYYACAAAGGSGVASLLLILFASLIAGRVRRPRARA